jgi:hypothetical protein
VSDSETASGSGFAFGSGTGWPSRYNLASECCWKKHFGSKFATASTSASDWLTAIESAIEPA